MTTVGGRDGVIVSITCWLPGTSETDVSFERTIRTTPDGTLYQIARGSYRDADAEARSAGVNELLVSAFDGLENQLHSPLTWLEQREAIVRVYVTVVSGAQSGSVDLQAIAVAPWVGIGAVITIDGTCQP